MTHNIFLDLLDVNKRAIKYDNALFILIYFIVKKSNSLGSCSIYI